ncbi:MAG: hypothetical protein IJE84_05150, partial [Clostridia bacterium]|nr:hypothetical protein [Clostridia bacterium]
LVVSLTAKFFKQNGSTGKYVMFCVAICFVSFIITPVFQFVQSIPKLLENGKVDSFEYDSVSLFSYNEMLLDSTDKSLRDLVCEISRNKFNIIIDGECVIFDYDKQDFSNVIIKSIEIDLSGSLNTKNIRELEEYISDMFMCNCEVRLA